MNGNAADNSASCHPQGFPDFYEVQVQLPDANGHLLSSAAFLPAAERFDLITKIDLHVIERVIRLLDDHDETQTPLCVAATLSEQTLVRPDFIEIVEGWLSRVSQAPDCLLITVRDDQSGSNAKPLQKVLEQLHTKGFGVILDEQTRGHSAFAHLRQYQAAYITINETS